MNNWNGSGFATRNPEIKTINTKNGEMKMAMFSIACQRKGKDAGADFVNCKAFGKTAEVIEKYIHQGSGIEIRGHIQTGSYEGKNGKVYTTDVIVDDMEFPKAKKNEESTPVEQTADTSSQGETHTQQDAPENGFMDIPAGIEATLPFR